MLKTIIVVCAICAGAGGTVLWAKWDPRAHELRGASTMPSIEELHLRAGARTLPDQTVREAF